MHVERLSRLLPDCGKLAKFKLSEPDLIIYLGSRTARASGAARQATEGPADGQAANGVAPHAVSGICEFHYQTMTMTTITELAV